MSSAASQGVAPPAVRDELSDLLRLDLLGPWGGEDEEFRSIGDSPRDRYVVGCLAPEDAGEDPDEVQEAADDDFVMAGESEDGDDDMVASPPKKLMFPSSFGFTFAVPASCDSLLADVSWGRYERGVSDTEKTPKTGKPATTWKRVPCGDVVPLDLTRKGTPQVPVPGFDDVLVRWRVRERGPHRVVTVFLINAQKQTGRGVGGKDASWLFQAQLAVTAANDGAVFLPREDLRGPAPESGHEETDALRMLYRDSPEHAVGHGIAVHVDRPEDSLRAVRLTTDALPSYDVPQTEAPDPTTVPGMEDLVLDMDRLATASKSEVLEWLSPLHTAYRSWLVGATKRIDDEARLSEHAKAARAYVKKANVAADRIEAGLQLITSDEKASDAFRFMNRAMALQRQHTEALRLQAEDATVTHEVAMAAVDQPSKRSWRPFQIAFVVLNLPSLADPSHPDRRVTDEAVADLLFFPTGGGKTEAYLGLTAFTFAIRRMQGTLSGRDGGAGMAVLMRYTLRLLTAQQFTRATTLVCATEQLRREALNLDMPSLGETPFRIGLWVGSSVTPNSFDKGKDAIEEARKVKGGRPSGSTASPMPIRSCPWCGSAMDPAKHMKADTTRRRIILFCGDPRGVCPFSEKRNPHEGLPIATIDEELYRDPPSLVIATVDKFAQMPWNGAVAHLFGNVREKCERHGYRHPDMSADVCTGDSHKAANHWPKASIGPVSPLRPPDLIIQDELHLIAGALGTMVGLYETAVDDLTTWSYNGSQVRAKVVASTATVRRAEEQVHHLFRRGLAVFPPPVLDASNSFFARQVPVSQTRPGRRYVGVCAPGVRLKGVEIRITSALLTLAQLMLDKHGSAADPYQTLVAYFGSLRELGGMRRLVEDDVTVRVDRPAHAELPRRYPPLVEELTSRVASTRIPDTLQRLERVFDPSTKGTTARTEYAAAMKAGGTRAKAARDRSQQSDPPVDVLLATNMFATGVDVPRLGLMSVTGQPKTTAEYIQASSRVGRDNSRPGLVVTIFNWARPRDLSHFETFEHYHETFYSYVEALSVTPFSPRALDRGLTGAFIGALRNHWPEFNPNNAAHDVDPADPKVVKIIDLFADRAASVVGTSEAGDLVRALLVARLDEWQVIKRRAEGSVLAYRRKRDGASNPLIHEPGEQAWNQWTASWSLRETEDEINLILRPDDHSIDAAPDWVSNGTPAAINADGGTP